MAISSSTEQLSQAIGRSGQNVRLASDLTGCKLNIMSQEDAENKSKEESAHSIELFTDELGVDEEIASILVKEGFTSIEEVAYVPTQELLEIDEFDEELVKELRDRAKDVLVNKALASEEQLSSSKPAEDLLALEGMDQHLAHVLASKGIIITGFSINGK